MSGLRHAARWVGVGLLAAAVPAVAWLHLQATRARDDTSPARARAHGRPIPVRTAHVARSPIEDVIGATALTAASESAVVRVDSTRHRATEPASDLVVTAVRVQEGDAVKRGQLLFELDDRVFRQLVRQQEAALAMAEAEVTSRQKITDNLRAIYETEKELATADAASAVEVYEAHNAYAESAYELAAATQRVEVTRVELEVARAKVERCRVHSPLDGTAGRIDVVPGMVLEPVAALTTIYRLDPCHVVMDLPQERIGEVRVGQEAEVVLDSSPGEVFVGTVVRLSPRADPELRVLPVFVEVRNPDGRIRSGVSGFARLRVNRTATTMPSNAAVRRDGKAMAYRVENGRARLREVRTGNTIDVGVVEVLSGLDPGDEVVIFHNFYRSAGNSADALAYLQDNDAVDVDWRKWAGRE